MTANAETVTKPDVLHPVVPRCSMLNQGTVWHFCRVASGMGHKLLPLPKAIY